MIDIYHLFEVVGIELEYMIVDRESLKVKPISDLILLETAGEVTSDVEYENLEWSNELVLHVIELKTGKPASKLKNLDSDFHKSVIKINEILEKHNAMLLPTGAHPFMNPFEETKLWPYDSNEIYEAYNKIFDCKGHGWSNLQSNHINLPFGNDEEFGRLHAAIRLVLPLIPAFAASTPILDGNKTGFIDSRLEVYRKNQIRIPSIAGSVIPEQVFSIKDYETQIFQKIYKDISPYDETNILKNEWLNSRGAIARFVRNSIEIRIVDLQEAPIADLAITEFVTLLTKLLADEKFFPYNEQKKFTAEQLSKIFLDTVKYGNEAVISDLQFLNLWGISNKQNISVQELLFHICESAMIEKGFYSSVFQEILKLGNLSSRILNDINDDFRKENLIETYKKLSDSLKQNKLFRTN